MQALTALVADISSLSQAPAETLTPMVAAVEEALAVRADAQIVRAAVATIMAGYRSADFHAPAEFARMAIEAVEDFPAVTLLRLASPKTGIVRRCKWPPSIAELVDWCEQDLAPVKSAVEMACRQIERQRSAERRATRALEDAAAKARAQAEWEADAPERERRAEQAQRLIEETAAKRQRENGRQKRLADARARWTSALCAILLPRGEEALARMYALSEADQDEATHREAEKGGAGVAYLLGRIGVDA